MIYTIYKLTSPSNKSYIGQTRQTKGLNERWEQHLNLYNRWVKKNRPHTTPYQPKLMYAFDKHGVESFTKEILTKIDSYQEADKLECEFIDQYNSIENGYNIQNGGHGWRDQKLHEDHKKNISESRKEYFRTEDGLKWKEELSQKFKENNPCKKGNIPWNKGIKCPEQSEKLKGKYTLTPKGREAKSTKMKAAWENGIYDNRPAPTKERMKALQKTRIGTHQTKHQKQCVSETLQKDWRIVSPTGEETIITNLRQFCLENKLDQGNIQRCGSKGWWAFRHNRKDLS